jgi:MoxR-like ATPase
MDHEDKQRRQDGLDNKIVESFGVKHKALRAEVHKVIVGQDAVIDALLVALFSRGHAILVGVPGLAKTLLVKTLAGVLGWDFKRIQFTPDMMPSDITGTEILQTDPDTGMRRMQFVKGPVFANFILADEINRAPPKTQAALLESMQEYTVTAAGKMYALEQPFMVAATQNPIEHEGTYPLPEAQLDRFMFNIEVDYPQRHDEMRIVDETTTHDVAAVRAIMSKEELLAYQNLVRRIPVSEHVLAYAVDLVKASRPSPGSLTYINEHVEWGAGPRACQYLILGAKSLALLRGLPGPSCKQVRDVAVPVLLHRIIPNYKAASKGINTKKIIETLLKAVKESDYSGKSARKVGASKAKLDLRSVSHDAAGNPKIKQALGRISQLSKSEQTPS